MATTATETERKYEAPAGARLPTLGGLPRVASTSRPEQQLLEAEYFDTDDLRLIRSGITLRWRRGGGDAGWHLKLPVGSGTRQEIRLPLTRAGQVPSAVPGELASLVHAYTRGQALRPVARISTRREQLTLQDDGGGSLAEVAADEVSAQTLGTQTVISNWSEVEVELTGGRPGLLKAADAQLRRRGLRPADRTAKLERALAGQLSELNGHGRPGPGGSAGAVVLGYLRTQLAAMKSWDTLVRRDEPDSVHQMRIAARRLRAALQSFGTVIPPAASGPVIGELKWLGGVLGRARDAEVLSGRLQRQLRDTKAELVLGPSWARVQGHFAPVQAEAQREVLAALESPRYFALLDALDQLLAEPPLAPAAARPAQEVLPRAIRRSYRRTARRLRRARHAPPGPRREAAYHEARKAAKRARYAGEAASPAIGKPAIRFTRQMKKIQSVLGGHQDAVVARNVDRELGIGAFQAGENAFTFGLLHEREDELARREQARARRTWRHAQRPHFGRWARPGH